MEGAYGFDGNKNKVPMTPNENILINGGFQIWEYGEETTGSGTYCANRWNCAFSGGDGPKPYNVKFKKGTNGGMDFQYLEGSENVTMAIRYSMHKEDLKRVRGKTVTLSWESEGKIYHETVEDFGQLQISNNELSKHITNTEIGEQTGAEWAIIISIGFKSKLANKTYNIKWIKLEFGKIATIFIMPDFEGEWKKCLPYYQSGDFHATGFSDGTIGQLYFNLPYPPINKPSVKIKSNHSVICNGYALTPTEVTFTSVYVGVDYMVLDGVKFVGGGTIPAFHPFIFVLNMEIDAEIR